ncbi:hypothetical protein OH799_19430 [Nocardia sp. NBC_00881]|uniref:hypothetical protein n=1 Tax=Nocardia sp. NBC_00881 TaxID=2975995 RepID=UPI003865CD86|nr:hypothetical protein OH799_19430 [Nocardia sp. NBC_00881]
MSAEPILTPEQAKQYLIEAFGASREYRMYPFELGWAIHPILSTIRSAGASASVSARHPPPIY